MIILGLDPGVSGGIAVIDTDKALRDGIEVYKLPETIGETWHLMAQYSGAVAYLEPANTSLKQSRKSAFVSGSRFGWLQMALLASGISVHEVRPKVWQKGIGISSTKGNCQDDTADPGARKIHKKKLRQRAEQLFTWVKMTDWKADAMLIAWYGMRQEQQTITPIKESA